MLPVLLGGVVLLLAWWAWENGRRTRHPVRPGLNADITIPHSQEFELYHNALSLCSMKARVCLAELGLPYKSHHIDLIETGFYENIRAPFLAVNPGGTVPVLVHDGHPIYESHEQIRYAAAHAPAGGPSLVPDEPAQRAAMEAWIDRSSITGDPMKQGDASAGNTIPPLTVPLFAGMIDQIPVWKVMEGVLFHFDKRRPAIFLLLKLIGLPRIHKIKPAMQLLARSRKQMGTHLDALEQQLERSGGPWILGAQYTLADVGWLVIFERLVQADAIHVFVGEGRRPACSAWWERIQKRPGYRAAILEHSHPIVQHGTARLRAAKAADPALRRALEGDEAGGGGAAR